MLLYVCGGYHTGLLVSIYMNSQTSRNYNRLIVDILLKVLDYLVTHTVIDALHLKVFYNTSYTMNSTIQFNNAADIILNKNIKKYIFQLIDRAH